MKAFWTSLALAGLLTLLAPALSEEPPYTLVLGTAQDAGAPQAGDLTHPGWTDEGQRRHPASLAIVDPQSGGRWLIDATPDFKWQLQLLNQSAPGRKDVPRLDGIFLTHAHIGHYLGLAQVGHEVMGTQGIPVFAMPRMKEFLSGNGPWDQLVRFGNIELRPLQAGRSVALNPRLRVTPVPVPHRQEYSEVVAYRIEGPSKSVLYLPDIDSWEELDAAGQPIEAWLAKVDLAYLDGTFFGHGEIPGRDMSGFPHPFIEHSLQRFASLPRESRAKIRFIHLNHTNPALYDTPQRRMIEEKGFRVAELLEKVTL